MSNFSLSIYTPSGIVIEGTHCEELSVPTTSGVINILKGHTHIISEVDTGILTAKLAGGQTRHFTMAGGLCKVLGNKVTILAKTSESPESIDIERAKAAISKAQSRLDGGVTSVAVIKFQRKLARAKNRIRLANLK